MNFLFEAEKEPDCFVCCVTTVFHSFQSLPASGTTTPLPKKLAFTRGQVEITAWGMIFRTLDAVKTQANKF